MKTVLLTGGIASGKSEACRHLASLGYPVYDCDSRAKALYDEVPGLKARAEKAAGLPFERFGAIFEDEARREALEAVVYPEVLADILRWKDGLGKCGICFIESAVAAERPLFEGLFDEVWMVTAPLDLRLARNPKAAGRIGAQHPESVMTDIVIENDGSLEELNAKIDNILKTHNNGKN